MFLVLSNLELYAQLDVQNGPTKIYYPNGQVASEGMVKDGAPDGFWSTYYETGILKSEGKRTKGQLDSTWNFYSPAGDLVEVINYQFGKRSGFCFQYAYNNPNHPGMKTLISKELYINGKKSGKAEYYYYTGELKSTVVYNNGKKEGYTRTFNKDSVLIFLEQYKDNYLISRERLNRKDKEGLKQGKHKEFYADGTLKSEINYEDNELHGYYRVFDEKGMLLQTIRYENGVIKEEIDEEAKEIIDFKRTFDEQGRITFSGGYREDIAIGIHRFFDTTGTVINAYTYNELGQKIAEGIVDEQGRKLGKWIDFYPSGEKKAEGQFRANRRSGNWVYYFRNGKVEQQGVFLNGRYSNEWIWFYPSGKVWRKDNFFNGQEDGHSVEYDENGKIITEGDYISGEKNGVWFYQVGDHKEVGEYIYGLREGKWTYYYMDDTILFEGKYEQGNPDGKQLYYYLNGKLKEEQFYKNGIREKTWRKYDENGNIILTVSYKNNIEVRINGIRSKLPDDDVKLIQ